jgi:ABC-type amino acid transport substrate-binding protein
VLKKFMNNNQIYDGVHQQLQGFYKIAIVNGSTKEVVWEQKEWKKNLILNQGMGAQSGGIPMDQVATGQAMCVIFDEPQTKLDTQTLTIMWKWTWSRIIGN